MKKKLDVSNLHIGAAVLTVALLAGLFWALSPSELNRVSVSYRTVETADIDGEVGYVEVVPGETASNLRAWLSSENHLVAPDEFLDRAGQGPGDVASEDPGSPLQDRVVDSVLAPAAPLLAAAEATSSVEFSEARPRVTQIHPDADLADRMVTGTFIEGITLFPRDGETDGGERYETGSAQRVVDVLALAPPGSAVNIHTDRGTVEVEADGGPFGLTLIDYRVPESLPEVEAPGSLNNPAAGLASAIALSDTLSPASLVNGRQVVSLGGVSADGTVSEVSHLGLRLGEIPVDTVDVLFIHVSQEEDVEAVLGSHVEVVGVETLSEAVEHLSSDTEPVSSD